MRHLFLFFALAASACTVHGSQTCSATGPSARAYATAVLVPTTNEVFLYGGQLQNGSSSDQLFRYGFTGCSGWQQLLPSSSSPGGWSRYAAAYDSMRNRIVYVGGPTNDVWSLDVDRIVWTHLTPTGVAPPVSQLEWAVYDSDNDRLIVGGIGASPLYFANDQNGEWQDELMFGTPTAPTSPPLAAAAAIDQTRDQVFIWNGLQMSTYSFNRGVGYDVSYVGNSPTSLVDAIAWDPVQKRLLSLASAQVYAIDIGDAIGSTATTTLLTPTGTAPSARSGAAFAVSGQIGFVFGGETPSGCMLDDLWYLSDESAWQQRSMATTCL